MEIIFNPPMAKGGGAGVDAPLTTGFSKFSQKWEELFLQTNFFRCRLILGRSVHGKIFQIGPTVLALKLDKESVLGGVPTPPSSPPIKQKLTYFSNHEDDI